MAGRNGKRPRRRKTTAKTTVIAKQPQPHGGALNVGGTPGNAGGTGRPPNAIRETARMLFDERLPTLAKIADNDKGKDGDRITAIDRLGKYGLEESREMVITSENARAFFDCVDRALREVVPDYAELVHARAKELFGGSH